MLLADTAATSQTMMHLEQVVFTLMAKKVQQSPSRLKQQSRVDDMTAEACWSRLVAMFAACFQ